MPKFQVDAMVATINILLKIELNNPTEAYPDAMITPFKASVIGLNSAQIQTNRNSGIAESHLDEYKK